MPKLTGWFDSERCAARPLDGRNCLLSGGVSDLAHADNASTPGMPRSPDQGSMLSTCGPTAVTCKVSGEGRTLHDSVTRGTLAAGT